MIYDFIVVGAGSAGAHSAYFLKKMGAKVLVLEQNGIASGASGAAGAFISPRLGRGGVLQKVTNEAFRFSIDFYKKNFPNLFYQTGLLRVPKDENDAKKFDDFKRFLDVEYKFLDPSEINGFSDEAKKFGGFLFKEAGVVDAKKVCEGLLKDIEVKIFKVSELKKDGDNFNINGFKSKNVILATGAWDELFDKSYIKISKVGGIRFDIRSQIDIPFSIHKKISISKKISNKIIIGATHTRIDDLNESYIKPNISLIDEAKKMVYFKEIEVTQLFCGVRSSVNDHLPIIGTMIDLKKYLNSKKIEKIDGLYVINGLGGRGFVFGPYLAKMLVDFILNEKDIDKRVDMDRYFYRYIKRRI